MKNALIFGDSYSTFRHCVPDGCAIYYADEPLDYTDVRKVHQTWWHQVVTEAGLNLVQNNSWSGSTIGYTGYDNTDCSQSSSFIYRFRQLQAQGFFRDNEIHTVFVFGGTNDSWANAPLGQLQYEDFQEKDLYCVLPAISYFLKSVKEQLPRAQIYCLINTELKPEIAQAMKAASAHYGIRAVEFETIHKVNGHPTIQGMQDIKHAVLTAMQIP